MLPIDRDNTQSAIDSLDTALEVLGRARRSGSIPKAAARATAASTAAVRASPISR